jgi:hypothetical protein
VCIYKRTCRPPARVQQLWQRAAEFTSSGPPRETSTEETKLITRRCCHWGAPTATSSRSNFSTLHAEIVTPFSHTKEHGSGRKRNATTRCWRARSNAGQKCGRRRNSKRTVLAACIPKLGRHNYFPASAFLHGQKRVAHALRNSCLVLNSTSNILLVLVAAAGHGRGGAQPAPIDRGRVCSCDRPRCWCFR